MSLILDGTNGETFPSWITSGRPASPATGQMGYNTTLGFLEVYNGSAWVQTQLPAAGTSGNVLSDNGTTWVSSAPSGGMTLLGTITPTAVNSISLGSLTLTSYKALFIALSNLAVGGSNIIYVSGSNQQSGGGIMTGSANFNGTGTIWVDLATSSLGGSFANNTVVSISTAANIPIVGGLTDLTTSSTTVYLRLNSTNNYQAQGSIKIYGVK